MGTIVSQKVFLTVDKFLTLIKSERYRHATASNMASLVLIILRNQQIEENDVNELLTELNKIEMDITLPGQLFPNKTKLSTWFFSLTKPTAAAGGKDLRNWLIQKKVPYTVFQNYLIVETKDILDFAAGFLLGISKSLVYDNIKGIFDLLKLTTIDLHVFLYEHEKESLDRLAQEYLKETERSKTLAVQSSGKLANQIINTFSNSDPAADLKRINAFAIYLTEIREIFIHFCVDPYVRAVNAETERFFEVFNKLLNAAEKELGKQSDEYKQAQSILAFIKNKYDREIETKVTPLLLQFKFFEAGAVFGEIVANIAQIVAGVVLLLWSARKFILKAAKLPAKLSEQLAIKLSRLSLANKVRLGTALTLINFWPAEFRIIPTLFTDSPLVILALKNSKKEYLKIAEAVKKGMPYVESQGVKLIDIDVAKNLAPSEEVARTVGMFESSVTGAPPNTVALFMYGGIAITVLLRRRKSKQGSGDDAFDAEVITRFQELYQEDALRAFLTTAETNKTLLSEEHFFKQVAEKEKLIIPQGATTENILQSLLKSWVEEFEKNILSQIKQGKKFKKKGIWSVFNSHINKKLRPVADALKNRGAIILIDQRFLSLTEKVLKLDAVIVFRGKETTVRKLMDMTVIEFYETFFPEKLFKQKYLKAIELLENEHPNTYKLYFERDEALKDIENAIRNKKPQEVVDDLIDRHDGISDAIGSALDELEQNKLITTAYKEQLQMYQYGKINPFGKCGMTRPDIGFVSIFEGTKNYDFVHVMEGALPPQKHLIGSDFYLDFKTVLFGETPLEMAGTKDITYTFSKEFLNKLED